MTTLYALLLARCGLSHGEAADFHQARLDTIKSWSTGRRQAPAGAIAELRALYAQIERAAGEILATIAEHPDADIIELGLASDDHEAQGLGWPCVGAQAAMLGIVAARSTGPVVIVPRGSTYSSAAAAEN